MDEKNKLYVFAVVALVIGAAVGVGAGYALFHQNGGDSETTYWFYFENMTDDKNDGWYSAKALSPTSAFASIAAYNGFELSCSSGSWGFSLSSFDNKPLEGPNEAGNYTYWMLFNYDDTSKDFKYSADKTLDKCTGTIFCYMYGESSMSGPITTPSGWEGKGPFA